MEKQSKVLVVDDDQFTLQSMVKALRGESYQVVTAASGSEALDLLRQDSFDLVLTDLKMPEVDGLEVLRRAREIVPQAVVLILTGYASVESAIEALREGAYDYLVKPCSDDELKLRIERGLERVRLAEEREQAEEALRESEEKYRTLVEQSLQGLIVIQDFRIVFANTAFAEISGYTVEELLSLSPEEIRAMVHPKDQALVWGRFRDRLAGKPVPSHYEYRGIRKDGTVRWLEMFASRIEYGGRPAIQGAILDITERKRAEEALERRAAQLATLNRIARHVASILDQQELLQQAVDAVQETLGYLRAAVLLVDVREPQSNDEEASELYVAAATDDFWEVIPDNYRQPVGKGAIGIAAETEATVLVSDASGDSRVYRVGEWFSPSSLSTPIKIGERVIGVLEVEADIPNAFDENDQAVLEIMADQVATGIENARLYEETKRRAEEMMALHETALDITAQLEMQRLLNAIITRASALLGATGGLVHLYDPASEKLVAVTSHNLERDYTGLTLEVGEGVAGKVFQTGQPLIIDDHRAWAGRSPQVEDAFARSILGVPLRWREQVIGVLDIMDNERVGAFDEEDLGLLTLFANQAAIAIENARLYEAEQERRHIAETLRQASTVLSATLELDEVLELILQQLREVIPYDSASVQRLQDNYLELLACQGFEEPGKVVGLVFPLAPKFPNYRVTTTKAPLAIEDIIQDYPHFKEEADTYESGRIRSWLGVPLVAKDQVIGMIAVDRAEVRPYTAEESELAMAFANQAAIAIENARLYERVERSLEQLTAVRQTSLDITARLDATALLEAVVRRAAELLKAKGGGIYLYDPTRQELTVAVDYGLKRSVVGTTLKLGEGMSGRVAQTGEPMIVDDYRTWSGRSEKYAEDQFTAVVEVPLKWQDQVIGTLAIVDEVEERVFTEDDAQLLSLFADQAAIAIENARLFEEMERLKAFNESIVQGVAEAILIEDAQGILTFANPAAEELLGYTREELIGQYWTAIVPEEQVEKVQRELAQRPRRLESRYETALLSKEGQVIPVIVSARPLFEDGEFAGVLSAFTDIRERVRRERDIEERRRYLEGVLGAAPDAIVTLDARHRIAEWNPGAERLFGYSREEAIGQDLDHLVASPDVFEEAVGFTQIVLSGEEVPPTEAVRYRKDGSPVDVLLAGSPIMVGDELIGVVAVYTDITERKRAEEQLAYIATHDPLTGVPNRLGLFTLAEQQLKMADRAEKRMLLLFADFDHLKRINDTLGHNEGDRALIEVANVLQETFRESDVIGRIGGDEFVVLAIETDEASAETFIARLRESLEARNAEGDLHYKLSLSVGIAHYDPERPCPIDELLARADRAMYERKRGNQKS